MTSLPLTESGHLAVTNAQGRDHWRKRNATLIAMTIAVHVAALGVILLTHDMPTVGAPTAGQTGITASLVAAPATATLAHQPPPTPHTQPRATPTPTPVVHERPVPHVMTTQAAHAPAVTQHAQAPAKADASQAQTPTPAPATAATSAATAATATATAATSANTDAAAHSTKDAGAATGLTRAISAAEMGQMNCRIPAPAYPSKARRLGMEGVVNVAMTIAKDGRIGNVTVSRSSGYPLLDDAAVEAISQGTCHPYMSAGQAVPVTTVQPVAFDLNS